MSILDRILNKRGLTYEELSHEERETHAAWQRVLDEAAVDMDKLKALIAAEIPKLSEALVNLQVEENGMYRGPTTKQLALHARLVNLRLLQQMIAAPEDARKKLEEQLERQFKLT